MSVGSIETTSFTSSTSLVSSHKKDLTTTKVIELIDCYACMKKTAADHMSALIHKSNTACPLHLSKRICVFCLTDLNQTCPSCQEDTATGTKPILQPGPHPIRISFWQSAQELQGMNLSDDAISRIEDSQIAQRATKYIHISRRHGCLIGNKGCVVICCCLIVSFFIGFGTYVLCKWHAFDATT